MTQTAKLTASAGAQAVAFGWSVAISGNTIVVGAPEGGPKLAGEAFVFVKPALGWTNMTQTAELTDSDVLAQSSCDAFGASVAISGTTIVVGRPQYGCFSGPGSASVFVKPNGGWTNMTQTAKLTASDAASIDQLGFDFGWSVSVSGNTIVVSAPLASPLGQGQGVIYVFVQPISGWTNMTQTAELFNGDAQHSFGFGLSVSISGKTVLVGAAGSGFGANQNQGAAYVFVEPSGGWANMTSTARLTASNGKSNDYFGHSVAISGNVIVVSALLGPGPPCPGATYLFVKPATGWQTTSTFAAELRHPSAGTNACYGNSVGITGRTVAVGAPCVGASCGPGAAYLYAF